MDWSPLLIIGAGTLRSVLGWLKTSLADGEISEFEWRELGVCVIRVGVLGTIVLYFPGLDLSGFEAAIAGFAVDMIFNQVRKLRGL